ERLRLGEGLVASHADVRVELRVEPLDAVEVGLHRFGGRELARAQTAGEAGEAHCSPAGRKRLAGGVPGGNSFSRPSSAGRKIARNASTPSRSSSVGATPCCAA